MQNHYCLRYYRYILHTSPPLLFRFHIQKFSLNVEGHIMLFVLYIRLVDTQV